MNKIINSYDSFLEYKGDINTKYNNDGNILSISSSILSPFTTSQWVDINLNNKYYTSSHIDDLIDTRIFELIDPTQIIETSNDLTLISESHYNYLNDKISNFDTENSLNKQEYTYSTGSYEQEYIILRNTINTTTSIINSILNSTIKVTYKNSADIEQDLESIRYTFSSSNKYILDHYNEFYSRLNTYGSSMGKNTISINVKQDTNSDIIFNSVNTVSRGIYYNNYKIPTGANFSVNRYFPIYLDINIIPTSSTLRIYSDEYNKWLNELFFEIIDSYDPSQYIRTYFNPSGSYSKRCATYIPVDRPFYINTNDSYRFFYIDNNSYLINRMGHKIWSTNFSGNITFGGLSTEQEYKYSINTDDIYNNTEYIINSEDVSGSSWPTHIHLNIGWLYNLNKINLKIDLKNKNIIENTEWANNKSFNLVDVYNNEIIDTIPIQDCYNSKILILSESKYKLDFNEPVEFGNTNINYINKYNEKQSMSPEIDNSSLYFDVLNENHNMSLDFNIIKKSINSHSKLKLNTSLEIPYEKWSTNMVSAWNSMFNDMSLRPGLNVYKDGILYGTFKFNKNTGQIDNPSQILDITPGNYRFDFVQQFSMNYSFSLVNSSALFKYYMFNNSIYSKYVYLLISSKIENSCSITVTQEDIYSYDSLSFESTYKFIYKQPTVIDNGNQ